MNFRIYIVLACNIGEEILAQQIFRQIEETDTMVVPP